MSHPDPQTSPQSLAREIRKAERERLERTLLLHIRAAGLPEPATQYQFCERRWRFDFAWADRKLAVEAEGGTWSRGAHSRGKGYESDCNKYNQAALLGWKVLRFTCDQIMRGEAISLLRTVFEVREREQPPG